MGGGGGQRSRKRCVAMQCGRMAEQNPSRKQATRHSVPIVNYQSGASRVWGRAPARAATVGVELRQLRRGCCPCSDTRLLLRREQQLGNWDLILRVHERLGHAAACDLEPSPCTPAARRRGGHRIKPNAERTQGRIRIPPTGARNFGPDGRSGRLL